MATTREWHSVEGKEAWAGGEPGPWMDEPDKVQWVDEATGLDCLIVRGPSGALCGYVGVPPEHPWHGLDYGTCPEGCEGWDCGHRPDSLVEVHGGLTFADRCNEPTREMWEKTKALARDPRVLVEAEQYPTGDAAQALEGARQAEWMGYEAWAEEQMGRRICHVAEKGRPGNVWWFGFDCAHYGDQSPRFDSVSLMRHGVYRTRAYVEQEVGRLAQQLATRHTEEG